MAKRDIITSPRMVELRRKRKKKRMLFFTLSLILLASILTGLSYLSKNKKFLINNIVINGTKVVDDTAVRDVIESNLSGNYVYLFAKANNFIYPESKIYRDLTSRFGRIDNLKITKKGMNTLVVDITERFGSFLWCGDSVNELMLKSGDGCYFINNDGKIFDVAPYFSGSIYFKFYTKLADSSVKPEGQYAVEGGLFRKIILFSDILKDSGFIPVGVSLLSSDQYTFYIDNYTNTLPKIIVSKESNLLEVMDNLKIALQKPELHSDIFGNLSRLLYIDLRFKNKVLYRFND